jgi:hypothetical protein
LNTSAHCGQPELCPNPSIFWRIKSKIIQKAKSFLISLWDGSPPQDSQSTRRSLFLHQNPIIRPLRTKTKFPSRRLRMKNQNLVCKSLYSAQLIHESRAIPSPGFRVDDPASSFLSEKNGGCSGSDKPFNRQRAIPLGRRSADSTVAKVNRILVMFHNC